MRYAIHFLVTVLVGWPSLIAGYLCAAVESGWSAGRFMYDRHEDAAIKKWLPGSAASGVASGSEVSDEGVTEGPQ